MRAIEYNLLIKSVTQKLLFLSQLILTLILYNKIEGSLLQPSETNNFQYLTLY